METAVLDLEKADRNDENKQDTAYKTCSTQNREKSAYQVVKRIFDIVVSVTGLLALGLPMLLIALLIRLDSYGPAIFKQERIGKNGKAFVMYKFRTMRLEAPDNVATNDLTNASAYITAFGRFLRNTSIDELPQLINVLRGEMSLVGFRPVCLTEKKLNQYRKDLGVFDVKPGMTGLAQVSGRDNVNAEEKASMDAEYAQKQSVWLDLWCLYKTLGTVVSQRGVK